MKKRTEHDETYDEGEPEVDDADSVSDEGGGTLPG